MAWFATLNRSAHPRRLRGRESDSTLAVGCSFIIEHMARTTPQELSQQAEAAFAQACRQSGLHVEMPPAGIASSDVVISRGGASWSVELKARAVADGLAPHRSHGVDLLVVVADVVTARVRDAYEKESVSWLDRRGHLRLIGPGLDIDAAIAPLPRQPARVDDVPRRPISGRGGVEVAVALLLAPLEPLHVRALARLVDMAPSTISTALARLRDASLVTPTNRPLVPELFWELAAQWDPAWVWLTRDPASQDAVIAPDVLVRTGDVAAGALGAPIVMGPSPRSQWYVASPNELDRVTARCGVASDGGAPTARVAVAPSAQITLAARTVGGLQEDGTQELIAPDLVVALDLAADPGRGQEILRGWHPQGAVWQT